MRITCILTTICTVLLLSCCSSEKSIEKKNIKEIAFNYEQALGNFDVESAEKYACKETKEHTLTVAKAMVKRVDRKYLESDLPATIKITNIQLTSDTTATAKWHKTTPRSKKSGTLELRKRNGKWQAFDPIKNIQRSQDKEKDATDTLSGATKE